MFGWRAPPRGRHVGLVMALQHLYRLCTDSIQTLYRLCILGWEVCTESVQPPQPSPVQPCPVQPLRENTKSVFSLLSIASRCSWRSPGHLRESGITVHPDDDAGEVRRLVVGDLVIEPLEQLE